MFTCIVCDKAYEHKRSLNRHLKGNNCALRKEESRVCTICSKAYKHKSSLDRHLKENNCAPRVCLKSYEHKRSLDRHLKKGNCAQQKEEKLSVCTACYKAFDRPSHLDQHMQTAHCGAKQQCWCGGMFRLAIRSLGKHLMDCMLSASIFHEMGLSGWLADSFVRKYRTVEPMRKYDLDGVTYTSKQEEFVDSEFMRNHGLRRLANGFGDHLEAYIFVPNNVFVAKSLFDAFSTFCSWEACRIARIAKDEFYRGGDHRLRVVAGLRRIGSCSDVKHITTTSCHHLFHHSQKQQTNPVGIPPPGFPPSSSHVPPLEVDACKREFLQLVDDVLTQACVAHVLLHPCTEVWFTNTRTYTTFEMIFHRTTMTGK
jgi:hypothetical protein